MRARYYNPDTGRFISEDTHWSPSNMIYGDRTFEEEETKYPDITASLQASNLYSYCMGNPITYMDINGNDVLVFGASAALDAFGISIEADEFLLLDDNWNMGRYVASGAGAGFLGASATGVIGWVDVDTIYDMSKITLTVSASGGEAAVISGTLNFNSEGKVIGGLVGIGAGAGAPVDFNVKPFTFSYVSGFNLKDTAKAMAKKALNVFDNIFNK